MSNSRFIYASGMEWYDIFGFSFIGLIETNHTKSSLLCRVRQKLIQVGKKVGFVRKYLLMYNIVNNKHI